MARTISVLIPARNAEDTIARVLVGLASAKAYIGEVILVDDGSTDDTTGAAETSAAEHGLPLTVLSGAANGASAVRNVALEAARSGFVYFVDADDLPRSEGLIAAIEVLDRSPHTDLVVGTSLDNNGQTTRLHRATSFRSAPLSNAEDYVTYKRPLFRIGTVVGRRELLQAERFPEGLAYQEDAIYWTRILTRARPQSIDAVMVEYFIDPQRSSARITDRHRLKFRKLMRHLLTLSKVGISTSAVRESVGLNALTLSRKLASLGDTKAALGYLRLSWSLSGNLRYRYAILKGFLRAACEHMRRRTTILDLDQGR